jgi:SAM-dependent methyltransferase
MPSIRTPRTEDGAAVYSPRVLKIYDRWVLGFSNSCAWACPTTTVLLPFFRQHLSANHLDVGVGSGFYLANSPALPGQQVTLLDLNENSLQAAAARIAPLRPAWVREDVLQPRGALGRRTFGSISLFYLLHCLPGPMSEKAPAVFGLLRRHLDADGVLYGATILGDEARHNWIGRRLMKLYNRKGIFGNALDTQASLESALRQHFAQVRVRRQGRVALFTAEKPLT